MNTVVATVVELSEDGRNAVLSAPRASSCARCLAGRGCGAGLLDASGCVRLEVALDGESLEPGQQVELDMAPSRLVEASVLAYGLPLAGMIAAAALASGFGEIATIVAATGGGIAGFAASRRWLARSGCLQRLRPRLAGRRS